MALFVTVARKTVDPNDELAALAQFWPATWFFSVAGVLLIGKKKIAAANEKTRTQKAEGAKAQ